MEAPKETPAEEDDSDDDIGPMPMKPSEPKEEKKEGPAPKESYDYPICPVLRCTKSRTHTHRMCCSPVSRRKPTLYILQALTGV